MCSSHSNFWWTFRCLDKCIHRCSKSFIPRIWLFSSSSSWIGCEDASPPLLVLVWIWRRTDRWCKWRLKTRQNYRWMAMPSTLSMLDIHRCSFGHNKLLQCQASMLHKAVNLDRYLHFKCPKSRRSKKISKKECFLLVSISIKEAWLNFCQFYCCWQEHGHCSSSTGEGGGLSGIDGWGHFIKAWHWRK